MTASAIWLSVPPSPDTSEIGEGERVRCTAACMAPGRGAFAVRGLRRFLPGRGGLANSQCYERRREKLRGGAVCCSQHAFPTLVCVAGPRPATGRGGLSGPLQALEFGLVHGSTRAALPACVHVAGVMHGHVHMGDSPPVPWVSLGSVPIPKVLLDRGTPNFTPGTWR